MKTPFVWRYYEGYRLHQGLNWSSDSHSKIILILRIWRIQLYFRQRALWLCTGENQCKRFVFHFDFLSVFKNGMTRFGSGLYYSWDTRSFQIEDIKLSQELLEEIIKGRKR